MSSIAAEAKAFSRNKKKPRSLFSGAGRKRLSAAQTGGPERIATTITEYIGRVIEYRLARKSTIGFRRIALREADSMCSREAAKLY